MTLTVAGQPASHNIATIDKTTHVASPHVLPSIYSGCTDRPTYCLTPYQLSAISDPVN